MTNGTAMGFKKDIVQLSIFSIRALQDDAERFMSYRQYDLRHMQRVRESLAYVLLDLNSTGTERLSDFSFFVRDDTVEVDFNYINQEKLSYAKLFRFFAAPATDSELVESDYIKNVTGASHRDGKRFSELFVTYKLMDKMEVSDNRKSASNDAKSIHMMYNRKNWTAK